MKLQHHALIIAILGMQSITAHAKEVNISCPTDFKAIQESCKEDPKRKHFPYTCNYEDKYGVWKNSYPVNHRPTIVGFIGVRGDHVNIRHCVYDAHVIKFVLSIPGGFHKCTPKNEKDWDQPELQCSTTD